MSPALKIVLKDFRRRMRKPTSLIVLLLFPLILCLLIGLAFNPLREGETPVTEIMVADHDRDVFSSLLKTAFRSAGDEAPPVDLREVSEEEGREAMARGEGSALLIIPAGFSDDYFDGKTVRLTLIKNPSQAILPEIAEQYTDVLVIFASYVSRFFEKELSLVRRSSEEEKLLPRLQWNLMGIGLYNKLEAVEKYLFPVPISIVEPKKLKPVESPVAGDQKSTSGSVRGFNVYDYLLPGLAVFGIFFLVQISFRDIYTELSKGMLARLLTAPVTIESFLMGKMISAFMISLFGLVVLQLVGYFAFGVNWGPPILVLAMDLIGVLGMSGVCLMIFSLARTQAQGEAILLAVIIFMSLFGGCFVPLDVLPPFFRRVANFTLNGNIIYGYNSLIFKGSLLPVWPGLLGITVVGISGFITAGFLLRRWLNRGI